MFNEAIKKINEIYSEEGLPLNLQVGDFDALFIKQVAKTEVYRRGTRDDKTGVLNNDLYNRVNPTVRNRNGATHYFLSKSVSDEIFPILKHSNKKIFFALTLPVQIPYSTLHLMLDHLPYGYYDSSKVDSLKDEYPVNQNLELWLSAKETSQNRVQFASIDYIENSDSKRFFLEFKYSQFENDYFILFKFKSQFKYLLLCIPQNLGDAKGLSTLTRSGPLFDKTTYTPVPSTYFQRVGGKNLIISGAPGTGKSRWIKEIYESTTVSRRVTFHPEYTYNEFIGSLRPISDLGTVSYEFVPGPFTKILQLAYSNPSKMYTLIIEEINRANTAAVFGDIFQILDRDIDGYSEYGIENEDIMNYINERLDFIQIDEVKLPPNLNIIATMNSADQGVFPMDTAFKRRWNYHYVPIKFDEWHSYTYLEYNKKFISVKDFIEILNRYLSTNQQLQINEDRLIGPYFLREEEAQNWLNRDEDYSYYKKLFLYLWDDIARIDRSVLFKRDYYQFSILCEAFEDGQAVFIEQLHFELETKLIDNTSSVVHSNAEKNNDIGMASNTQEVDESNNNQEDQNQNSFSENIDTDNIEITNNYIQSEERIDTDTDNQNDDLDE